MSRPILTLTRRLPYLSRPFSSTLYRHNIPSWPNPPVPQPPVGPSDNLSSSSQQSEQYQYHGKQREKSFWTEWLSSPSFQAALTTVVGLGMVFAGGMAYLEWYKAHVLHRVGYPVYEHGKKYLLIHLDHEGVWAWICECIFDPAYAKAAALRLTICTGSSLGIVKAQWPQRFPCKKKGAAIDR